MIQVEAPTAIPHFSPKAEEKRLPVTPEKISKRRNLNFPRKNSELFPSITNASMFHTICQMFKCKIVGVISLWKCMYLWMAGRYFAPMWYKLQLQL